MADGDALARGAKSATFPSLSHIKQSAWDAIWADEPKTKKNEVSQLPKKRRKTK